MSKIHLTLLVMYVCQGLLIQAMPLLRNGMTTSTHVRAPLSSPSISSKIGTQMTSLSSGFNSPASIVTGFATGRFTNPSSSSGALGSTESGSLSCSPMDTRPVCLVGSQAAAGSTTLPDLQVEEMEKKGEVKEVEIVTVVDEEGRIVNEERRVRSLEDNDSPSTEDQAESFPSGHKGKVGNGHRRRTRASSVVSHIHSGKSGSTNTLRASNLHDSTILPPLTL
ncbi:MAG: hypothetical protein DHS80DRAFT_29200 [Piptocephalis tieghemiana]|nr:MAG: hypothetical protein DHS80DRAFT_29200 [Piptocephalis tieghemiana]